MAKLVWQPPGQEPMAFAIRQERVAVGRDAGNDVRLPEPAVSSRHAVIITRMNVSTVHDLNSSNGTWINGKRIESQSLQHGDVVQFGRLSMTYIDESGASSTRQPGRPGTTQREATVTLNTPPPRPAMPNLSATGTFRATGTFQAAAPQQAPDAPDLSDLDRLMGAIRSYRDGEDKQNAKKREELMTEWKKVMSYCSALKSRLSNEPRVRYFEISDRRNEVVIRTERAPDQPTQLLMLTLGHIEKKDAGSDGIWMRQPASPDKRYEKCADVMRDLVTTIAHMLA